MRDAFAAEITQLAQEDARVVLLSGDIGNRLFDSFKEKCPGRFINCGVAEANLVGCAAGLAMCGARPVTYTIASFMTTRCLEQIRVDVCYHNLPVVIVGVGAGLSYAANGGTHHSLEDISLMRMLPNMKVVAPGDPLEVRAAIRALLREDAQGPVYFRIGKKGEPVVHAAPPHFEIGRGIWLNKESDAGSARVVLLATGNMLPGAREAATRLDAQGVPTALVSMHTIKPLDEELLEHVFFSSTVEWVVTVEEHSRMGGLGGAVAEWLADRHHHQAPSPARARLLRIGTPDSFFHEAGGQAYARERLSLAPAQIAANVLSHANANRS